MVDKEMLTIDELLARWRGIVARGTLANWRVQGKGPSFVKVGKAVLYPVSAVEAFEANRLG